MRTFFSTLCTSTLDVITQKCPIEPYLYRESVKIPKAGFLDDILDITYCGLHTKQINCYTNEEIRK